MPRTDGRRDDEARPLSFEVDFLPRASGSCVARAGRTHVLVSATVEEGVPSWMKGRGEGWITAEYSMLPAAVAPGRKSREGRKGVTTDGRSVEIQRIIGRVLRAVVDRRALGERTVVVDCDVLAADAGTRTTSMLGAVVALGRALAPLGIAAPKLSAASVVLIDGAVRLDPDYSEDSRADADCTIVHDGQGRLVEVGASAEGGAFSDEQLVAALALARAAAPQTLAAMEAAIAQPRPPQEPAP